MLARLLNCLLLSISTTDLAGEIGDIGLVLTLLLSKSAASASFAYMLSSDVASDAIVLASEARLSDRAIAADMKVAILESGRDRGRWYDGIGERIEPDMDSAADVGEAGSEGRDD